MFPPSSPFFGISIFSDLGLAELLDVSLDDHLVSVGVGRRYIDEIAAAITRCNYGQAPSQINAFAGLVGLAGSGSVRRGLGLFGCARVRVWRGGVGEGYVSFWWWWWGGGLSHARFGAFLGLVVAAVSTYLCSYVRTRQKIII